MAERLRERFALDAVTDRAAQAAAFFDFGHHHLSFLRFNRATFARIAVVPVAKGLDTQHA
jgi:hypothetical protein